MSAYGLAEAQMLDIALSSKYISYNQRPRRLVRGWDDVESTNLNMLL